MYDFFVWILPAFICENTVDKKRLVVKNLQSCVVIYETHLGDPFCLKIGVQISYVMIVAYIIWGDKANSECLIPYVIVILYIYKKSKKGVAGLAEGG